MPRLLQSTCNKVKRDIASNWHYGATPFREPARRSLTYPAAFHRDKWTSELGPPGAAGVGIRTGAGSSASSASPRDSGLHSTGDPSYLRGSRRAILASLRRHQTSLPRPLCAQGVHHQLVAEFGHARGAFLFREFTPGDFFDQVIAKNLPAAPGLEFIQRFPV